MKKWYYYLFSFLLLAFTACSEENEQTTPPSKGEEAVEEIVNVLEEQEEISQFVEMLKQVDMAQVTEEKLTIFAVRNPETGVSTKSEATVLDSTSIKRHIAIGSYPASELTDGKTLTSINGETLYISRSGDDIYVNGTMIEGEAIAAGESYVYVVPQVLEKKTEPTAVYTHTISIRELEPGVKGDKPLAEVTIKILTTDGDSIGTWLTNEEGEAVIRLEEKNIQFTVSKSEYSYLYDGYFMAGTDENGEIIKVDMNGDGILDNNDRPTELPHLYYSGCPEDTKTSDNILYMIHEEEVVVPDLNQIAQAWQKKMNEYIGTNLALENQLTGIDLSFNYNKVETVSDSFWDKAYETIAGGKEYLNVLQETGKEGETLTLRIRTDISLVYTQLYGYYGQLADYAASAAMPLGQLTDDIRQLMELSPEQSKCALYVMLGKIQLSQKRYNEALDAVKVCEAAGYVLSERPDSVMYSTNNPEIIWGGYATNDNPPYIHPLLFREVLLIGAIASAKIGNEMQALEYLNRIYLAFGMEPLPAYSDGVAFGVCSNTMKGTGQRYPYARILIIGYTNVDGFDLSKHTLLPIPKKALQEIKGLYQNSNY